MYSCAVTILLCFTRFYLHSEAFTISNSARRLTPPRLLCINNSGGTRDENKRSSNDDSQSFIFVEKTDAEMGQFDLSKLRKRNSSPLFDLPPPETSLGSRTGVDGDKVIAFTVLALALMVQYFLFSNHDVPSFDEYIPLSER